MKVEVWSDIVCPFCWIGRRHLQQAIQQTGADVAVVHRAYELNPDAGPARPVHDYLAQRFGGMDRARSMTARAAAMGRQAGLAFDFERAVVARTFDAHRLVHLGRLHGLEEAMLERLMASHFNQGADVADPATLRRLAVEVGLPGEEVDHVLDSQRFAQQVRDEQQEARSMGVSGVPFFAFDRQFALVGAQPVASFVDALARAKRQ